MLRQRKQRFTALLLLGSLFLTGCSGGSQELRRVLNDTVNYFAEMDERVTKSSSSDILLEEVTATGLEIEIDMGSVIMSVSDKDEVNIDARYRVTGIEEEKVADLLSVVELDCQIKDDTLFLQVINKDTKEDIWQWIRDNYDTRMNSGLYNMNVDLDIQVPAAMEDFEIVNSMGNIELKSIKGAFQVSNNMGNVMLRDVTFTGDSDIEVSMGNIDCRLSDYSVTESRINLLSSMGNIVMDTNGKSFISERKDGDEDFMGGQEAILIADLCEIEAEVDMGDINIHK